MNEIVNCPRCNELYAKNAFRDVCPKCSRSEEELYQKAYTFLRKRENRAATMERLVEVTGATEGMIHNWIRKGRLQPAQFPNLGYPCDRCGTIIQKGKLCASCVEEIEKGLQKHEREQAFSQVREEQHQQTYLGRRKD
ncbi:TIGR03826 family flagellar region protein [Domibacillus indicus]|uniref:TIGR03826 family flagellar region protein n=1 Tax=Domibacillus indicus TaxID=1437523 RepID=UPI000617C987|nr:TIGR03826 family flagellar region protein [Domibacillus indicus]